VHQLVRRLWLLWRCTVCTWKFSTKLQCHTFARYQ